MARMKKDTIQEIKESGDRVIGPVRLALYRRFRTMAYLLLAPPDALVRRLTQKGDFPPPHLRRHSGPLRTFEMSGAEFLVYLKLLCKLRPEESVLDIGCGCGLMALFLRYDLDESGRYTGMDIHAPSIRWCQRHIPRRRERFEFLLMDVANKQFNPRGGTLARDYVFPFPNGSFDVVLVKSVFTHMRPEEVDNYVKEIARVLSARGRCLLTFFLLHQRQQDLAKQGLNRLSFKYGDETWRYAFESTPETAIAYDRDHILRVLDRHGLALKQPIYWGTWSGMLDGLSFQDIAVIGRKNQMD